MERDNSLQERVGKESINLEYSKQKNKKNWKKWIIYGSVIGAAGTATSLYLLSELSKYVDRSIGKTLEVIMNY